MAGTLRHARPPRPCRARAQVDKDICVHSRAGQGTADLVRRPARLTRAALLGQALPNAVSPSRSLCGASCLWARCCEAWCKDTWPWRP